MAGRATYGESDRARVFVALTANDGNIKRTARETGVPENTVRRWKKEFATDPPEQEAVAVAVEGYAADLEGARNEALVELRKKIPTMSGRDLGTIFGILDDKLTRAKGLNPGGSENPQHHVLHLPPTDELVQALQGLAVGAVEASRAQEAARKEAGLTEQPALPAGLKAPRP